MLDSGWAGQPGLKMVSRGETLSRDLADELLQRGSELWNQYTSHSPLIQVLVNLPNAPLPRERLEHLTWEELELDCGVAQFDLTFSFDWGPNGCVSLDYSTDLFEQATVARMIAHFETLLKAAVADPDRRLSEIPLLRPVERQQLLVTWNRTAAPISPTAAIDGLFEEQANRTPDAVAVTDREGSLTFIRRTLARSGWTATSSPSRCASGTMRTSRRSCRTFTSSIACSD
jgi:non-ribosomal peptide synthetase component F